jgi:hypothetical protein
MPRPFRATVFCVTGANNRTLWLDAVRLGQKNQNMKTFVISLAIFSTAALIAAPSFAQNEAKEPTDKAMQPAETRLPEDQPKTASSPSAAATSPSQGGSSTQTVATGQPSAADMQQMMAQMMELAKPGENHKLLAGLVGTWNYTVKMWMNPDPNAKPEVSKGTATRKAALDGHYFLFEVSGKMQMPGPDGKMKDMDFKGMSIEAYNNVTKKFEAAWMDNMGTGIFISQGDYDPATKTFTYTGEMEMVPGTKTKVRELVKVVDKDHHMLEWYEDRGGQEAKTMEIAYTRKK